MHYPDEPSRLWEGQERHRKTSPICAPPPLSRGRITPAWLIPLSSLNDSANSRNWDNIIAAARAPAVYLRSRQLALNFAGATSWSRLLCEDVGDSLSREPRDRCPLLFGCLTFGGEKVEGEWLRDVDRRWICFLLFCKMRIDLHGIILWYLNISVIAFIVLNYLYVCFLSINF